MTRRKIHATNVAPFSYLNCLDCDGIHVYVHFLSVPACYIRNGHVIPVNGVLMKCLYVLHWLNVVIFRKTTPNNLCIIKLFMIASFRENIFLNCGTKWDSGCLNCTIDTDLNVIIPFACIERHECRGLLVILASKLEQIIFNCVYLCRLGINLFYARFPELFFLH